jgi:pimeloyl-ACP methyl ester carboxylesterase
MGSDRANAVVKGDAAGVPYLATPPTRDLEWAPLVVIFHMMDPPRSEAAMAAALPMRDVLAWRVYLGLPMFGARTPAGGPDEIMRLGYEDALMNLLAPVVEQAAAELPAAVAALHKELSVDEGPIGLVGGSAGGAAALLALAETEVPVAAVALVNPAVRATAVPSSLGSACSAPPTRGMTHGVPRRTGSISSGSPGRLSAATRSRRFCSLLERMTTKPSWLPPESFMRLWPPATVLRRMYLL